VAAERLDNRLADRQPHPLAVGLSRPTPRQDSRDKSQRSSASLQTKLPSRLIGSLLLEQNDEWAVQRARHMTRETIAPMSNYAIVRMPALAT
jgi:hypothetical protein